MDWIKRLSELEDSWQINKEQRRGIWGYECYLSCHYRYEEFNYISMGEGATIEEAVVAAFTDWDKKHDRNNS